LEKIFVKDETMTADTVNDNLIASGIPMNLEGMRLYLQNHFEVPIALRRRGATTIKCPYCACEHNVGPQPGYHASLCSPKDRESMALVVGERYFVPGYGVVVFEYEEKDGVNELLACVWDEEGDGP